MMPESVASVAGISVYASDYDVDSVICPCCGGGWLPNEQVFSEMARELEGWDRRYDSAKSIVACLMVILTESASGLVQVDSEVSV